MLKLRKEFWGGLGVPLQRSVRKDRVTKLLRESYHARRREFIFTINRRSVCERGFLILLGIMKTMNKNCWVAYLIIFLVVYKGLIKEEGRYPRMWTEAKSGLVSGRESTSKMEQKLSKQLLPGEKLSLKTMRDERSQKFLGCIECIKYCAKIFADTCPTDSNIQFLPHETPTQFYEEYKNFHKTFALGPSTFAQIDTFKKALDSLHDSIRLVHAKGSFPTCDICNNANDLLRSPKVSYNPEFRDIVMKFKRAHLMRQMEERAYMERNINRARTEIIGHQPQVAHFLCDAISNWRGNTPKVGGVNIVTRKVIRLSLKIA